MAHADYHAVTSGMLLSFGRKLTNWEADVLNEKSEGRLRAGGGALCPRVWGEVCPSSVLSRPSPRVFGIRETLVCPASGRALLPASLACGPCLPSARPCGRGVARPGCRLLLLQTAGWRPLTTWPQECSELALALATGCSWPSALGGPFVPLAAEPFFC